MKKLKLIGNPKTIFKKTAIIENMFNSELESDKFIKSKIQTQSGIRGIIKQNHYKNGLYRATFEDKILMSDIIILKGWTPIKIPKI